MMNNFKKRGFTLIELVVVMAIIGILISIAVPRINAYQESAKRLKYVSDSVVIHKAVISYCTKNSDYIDKNIGNSLFYSISQDEIGNFIDSDCRIVNITEFDMKSEDVILVYYYPPRNENVTGDGDKYAPNGYFDIDGNPITKDDFPENDIPFLFIHRIYNGKLVSFLY